MDLDLEQLSAGTSRVADWRRSLVRDFSGRPAIALPYPELQQCFPVALLESTLYVVTRDVPSPPMREFGLPGMGLDDGPLDGLTLGGCYFVREETQCAALHFHELVHVVQWHRLGFTRFVWTYAVGLLLHGYRDSPLERAAYDLQLEFEHRIYRGHLISDIERRANAAWKDARRHLPSRRSARQREPTFSGALRVERVDGAPRR